ncbi:MAG TPA: hypothetical protein VFW25_12500 [Silvibacterium sp.]|nr:hypothetical protein [Silvibacterium sp.]
MSTRRLSRRLWPLAIHAGLRPWNDDGPWAVKARRLLQQGNLEMSFGAGVCGGAGGLRAARGLSLRSCTGPSGLSSATLSRIERG